VDWLCDQIPEFRWPLKKVGLPTSVRKTIYYRTGKLEDNSVSAFPFNWMSKPDVDSAYQKTRLQSLRYAQIDDKKFMQSEMPIQRQSDGTPLGVALPQRVDP
jgi:hypothetical protein